MGKSFEVQRIIETSKREIFISERRKIPRVMFWKKFHSWNKKEKLINLLPKNGISEFMGKKGIK